jgi:hypothetical protein
MTCHICANPTCVDDCQHFPPPALKVGGAEQKLVELLKIAEEMADSTEWDGGDMICSHCHGIHDIPNDVTKHHPHCPILKLEQFKQTLK